MIFAASIGSDGSGQERYVSYFPFVLAPGADLAAIDGSASSTHGAATLRLEKLHHLYAISFGPFASVETATASLDRLRAAFLWLSLSCGVGVSYSRVVGDLTVFDTPKSVLEPGFFSDVAGTAGWTAIDGHYDADKALIRPDHKRLTRWEMGRATVTLNIGIENFFQTLRQALSFDGISRVAEHPKLRLAIELYATHRFELSDNARFISLVTTLESLLPDMKIPKCSLVALTQARAVVKETRERYPRDSPEWSAIGHLLSRVSTLEDESIGMTLRNHVSSIVSRHSELGNQTDVVKRLRDVYSARCVLLHEGRADDGRIKEHLSFLQEFVPRLLATLFRKVAEAEDA